MPNLLRLRGADGSTFDFEDDSMVEWFKFFDPPGATVQRDISALGCGGTPGATASLNTDRYLYTTRKYQVGLWDAGQSIMDGGSFRQVELYAQQLEHQILKAKWHNLDFTDPTVVDGDGNSVTACAVWLERQLYDQPVPEVWTVLTGPPGKTGRIHEERYGIPRIVIEMSIDCMEGAVAFDTSGFAVSASPGGTTFGMGTVYGAAVVYGGMIVGSGVFF